jgi:hypothetical protein
VSRSDIEVAEETFLRPVRDRGSAGLSERIITKVLGTQRPDCVTVPHEPFNLSQSLPGGSPLVDLLRVRARSELGWDQLLNGISLASVNRTPSHHEFRNVEEITLGETLGSRILDIAATLRDYRSQLKEKLLSYLKKLFIDFLFYIAHKKNKGTRMREIIKAYS